MAKAYPKYYQGPTVIKQMPVKTTVPCTKCGTTQVKYNRQKLASSIQLVLRSTHVKAEFQFFSTEFAMVTFFISCTLEGREALQHGVFNFCSLKNAATYLCFALCASEKGLHGTGRSDVLSFCIICAHMQESFAVETCSSRHTIGQPSLLQGILLISKNLKLYFLYAS